MSKTDEPNKQKKKVSISKSSKEIKIRKQTDNEIIMYAINEIIS